jgi:hypothetical protein
MKSITKFATAVSMLTASAVLSGVTRAYGEEPMFLPTIRHHSTVSSTIADNGDLNPYAIVIAPVSAGKIHEGDVLVDNFNNLSNLQGTGTTIVSINPKTRRTTTIAKLPNHLPQTAVGLTTAMTMLKSGWIIVGSTPSSDGTTRTKGPGALIAIDPNGNVADVWTGPNINGPWGNIAVIDNGNTATLFISMAGNGMPSPDVADPKTGRPIVVNKATIVRFELSIPPGKPPTISSQTVIASGLGQRADRDAFMVGPTGLALAPDGTLYASDAVGNQIVAISDAAKRTDDAGTGRTITRDGLLRRPLALIILPNGHLLTCNGTNGQVVEIDPIAGKQLCAQWIDNDQAQSPPGNGDLFGMALRPDGKAFYYVEDDMNTLVEAHP